MSTPTFRPPLYSTTFLHSLSFSHTHTPYEIATFSFSEERPTPNAIGSFPRLNIKSNRWSFLTRQTKLDFTSLKTPFVRNSARSTTLLFCLFYYLFNLTPVILVMMTGRDLRMSWWIEGWGRGYECKNDSNLIATFKYFGFACWIRVFSADFALLCVCLHQNVNLFLLSFFFVTL